MYACVYCAKSIRPSQHGVIREVKGWVRDRSQGGVNHLIAREETGRFAHYACAIGDDEEAEELSLWN